MKKLFLLLIMLFPITVKADLNVISHYIDAEVEIAGALNVKELIVVEGEGKFLSRNLNYYSFKDQAWDGKTVEINDGTIYNGDSVSISKVSAFVFDDKVEYGSFDKNVKNYFSEFNIKKPSNNTYLYEDNNDGTGLLKIFYPVKNKKIAFYINYIVTNLAVKHNDLKEVNYTFKNLYDTSKETYLRVITPYPVAGDLYNVWVHGNKTGEVQELINKNEQKIGFIAKFTENTRTINFRMTLPHEQIGVDMFLNNSNKDALEEIKTIESTRLNNTNRSNRIVNIMSYALIGMGIIYVLLSVLFIKNDIKILFYIYLAIGLVIMLFNYLFRFNYWYLYLIVLAPIITKLIKKFIIKK